MLAEITASFPGGPQAARTARHFLMPLQDALGRDLLDDIALLTSELVTNSVRHGGVDADATIELDVAVGTDRVRVEVRDPGPDFEPHLGDRDPTHPGGWGLLLVDRLARAWGRLPAQPGPRGRPDGVWFELDCSRRAIAATGAAA